MAAVRPMLASLDEPPVAGTGLVYEPKYDGIRALAAIDVDTKGKVSVALYSRNGNEKHDQFPAITAALANIGRKVGHPLLIDGEIVAIDATSTDRSSATGPISSRSSPFMSPRMCWRCWPA